MSKKTIRTSVFETNSSSVHAYAHLSEEAYDEWQGGAYIDLRTAAEDDDYAPSRAREGDAFTDVSQYMIGHSEIGRVRKELPDEHYYRHPDDCLLEAGILPYNAMLDPENGTPSQEWASRCGGLLYLYCTENHRIGGYDIEAGWMAW